MTAVLQAMDALRSDRLMAPHDEYNHSSTDWKAKYMDVADMLAETRAELDEFHVSSKELEEELERELERTEKAQQDLKVKLARAEQEREEWKSKFMALQTTHNTTTTSLQRELDTLRQDHQKTKVQLRELEMGNDDLERNERAISSSLADMEQKYSRVLEEKILLEHELLDKANVEEEFQRLKDQLRDANEEVTVLKERLETSSQRAPSISEPPSSINSHSASEDQELSTPASEDLQLADLLPTPAETPAKESLPKIITTPRNAASSMSSQSSQATLLHRAGFQPPRAVLSTLPSAIPSPITRSITVSTFSTPTRTPSNKPSAPRNASYPITAGSVPGSTRSRGVQMVSEMRARVKVLEQKIHTRVPRLRMGSVTNRNGANAMPPPKAIPVHTNVSPVASTSSLRSNSIDEKSSNSKPRRSSFDVIGDAKRTPVGDSSGWVLIMEDSPSPVKDKDKERKRTSGSPSAPSAFRPLASTSAQASPTGSRSTSALSQSVMPTGIKRPQSRLSTSTEGRSSVSTNATTSTTSSILTPSSRPSTPTFLPVPTSGMYQSSIALKRSTGPPVISHPQPKRSSLGTIKPPTSMHPPSSLPAPHANITVRSTSKSGSPALAQSRIGRPPSGALSGRKSVGEDGPMSDGGIPRGRTGNAMFGRHAT